MSKTVVGLDIGDSALKFAYRKGKQGMVAGAVRLPEQLVKDGRIRALAPVADCIRRLHREQRLPRNACYAVNLPESAAICRRLTLPCMTKAQLRLNLPYEFREFVAGSGENYYYDYAVEGRIPDTAQASGKLELFAAAVRKSVVAEYRELFRLCALKLQVLEPEAMIWSTLLRCSPAGRTAGSGAGCCIVDMGHHMTRILFFRGSSFRCGHCVELGGADLDEAISLDRNMDVHQARLCREAAQDAVAEEEACRAVYRRIALELRRAVDYYRFSEGENPVEEVYFAGGSACIRPLCETLSRACGLPVRSVTALYPEEVQGEMLWACAPAVGLSLCGREVLENA